MIDIGYSGWIRYNFFDGCHRRQTGTVDKDEGSWPRDPATVRIDNKKARIPLRQHPSNNEKARFQVIKLGWVAEMPADSAVTKVLIFIFHR